MSSQIKNLKKKIIYLLIIIVILIISYFLIYQKFISSPQVSLEMPVTEFNIKTAELKKTVDKLFNNPKFKNLKEHGKLLPSLSPIKTTLKEIELKEIGTMGRENPFSPTGY